MKIKRSLFSFIILCTLFLCACQQNEVDYTQWIPDHDISELNLDDDKITSPKYRVVPDESQYTPVDEIAQKLLNHEDVSDLIYKNQIINNSCLDLSETISSKRTIIYVSSSEGNNLNDGRTPQTPKKSFDGMSEKAGIALLLKSGDTFNMKDMFYVGDNTVICSYGEGPRPVLDFSKQINEPFIELRGYEHVWAVDLSRTDFNTAKSNRENYNFGQLYFDGACNWNRYIVLASEIMEFDFPGAVSAQKDNCWAVDWVHGVLYLYSEVDPNEHEIRVSEGKHGLNFKAVRNAIVSDLEIIGPGAYGCKIADCTDVSIQNCVFKNIGGALSAADDVRYGNGVQLTNVAQNVTIKNNVFDGVFNCGYSDRNLMVTDKQENVTISGNIFAHCYCGIEQYDDNLCLVPIKNLSITDNLIFESCDVTNPYRTMFADINGNLTTGVEEYRSYRNYNPYERITSVLLSAMQIPSEFHVSGNVFWQTNRLLMCIDANYGYPEMKDNYFFSLVGSERDALFATALYYKETAKEEFTFAERLQEDSNIEVLQVTPAVNGAEVYNYSSASKESMDYFKAVVKKIVGE